MRDREHKEMGQRTRPMARVTKPRAAAESNKNHLRWGEITARKLSPRNVNSRQFVSYHRESRAPSQASCLRWPYRQRRRLKGPKISAAA